MIDELRIMMIGSPTMVRDTKDLTVTSSYGILSSDALLNYLQWE